MAESISQPIALAESSSRPGFGLTDVLLFAMAAIWGTNFVVVKYATGIFNPVAFTGLRVGTVAIFMILFALLRRGGAGVRGRRHCWDGLWCSSVLYAGRSTRSCSSRTPDAWTELRCRR